MKAKHTPGPWNVQRAEEDMEAFDVVSDSLPYVATVHGNGEPETSETEATARLIAAAPDLLDACREAYNTLPTGRALEMCIRAIEKAEGK